MKKFILLRGHEGSGKSTFAQQKIAEFLDEFPNAEIVHLDNDADLIDENGVYQFDFERFAAAHRKNTERFQAALKNSLPEKPTLIINANPNQKAKNCYAQLDLARRYSFETEIYRLHHFFANVHGVSEADVRQSYARLNANPVDGEIHLNLEIGKNKKAA